ncbi:MAG: tetratricopeptide repeat protein [bacterium]
MTATTTDGHGVILIVGEPDLVSDFQQHFAGRGVTVRLVEDTTAARAACEGDRPRLIVIPNEGAFAELLKAWSQGSAPADIIIALVETLSEAGDSPACVTRTARRGQSQEIVSLAELLLRSEPAASPPGQGEEAGESESESESIWNKPGGILANRKSVDDGDWGEEADIDPSRVSDIRNLGVAVRMAKTMGAASKAAADPSGSIKLRHADGGGLTETPAEGSKVADALASLPEARAAKTFEEQLPPMPSAPTEAAARKPRDPTKPRVALEPSVARPRSRRRLVMLILLVVVLGGGGAAAWLLLRGRGKGKADPGTGKQATAMRPAPMRAGPQRGVYVDEFAGVIAQLPKAIQSVDVDATDEFLNRSVPELNPFLEQQLRRMSRKKQRAALIERGRKLLGWERYPEARRYLKRALELKDTAEVRSLLATAHAKLGRRWTAVRHLKAALDKDAGNPDYLFRLGLLYVEAGKKRKKKGCRFLRDAAKRKERYAGQVEQLCGKGNRRRP